MTKSNVEWVLDKDDSYYGMYCVHPKDDTDFDSPRRFHFAIRKNAEKFLGLISICHCAVPVDNEE